MAKYMPQWRFRRPPKWVSLTAFGIHCSLVAAVIMNVFPLWDGIRVSQSFMDVFALSIFITLVCPNLMALALSIGNILLMVRNPTLTKQTTTAHILFGVVASLSTAPSGLLFLNGFFPGAIRFTAFQGFFLASAALAGVSLLIFASEQFIAAELSRTDP